VQSNETNQLDGFKILQYGAHANEFVSSYSANRISSTRRVRVMMIATISAKRRMQ
jgi:hypothetical protein